MKNIPNSNRNPGLDTLRASAIILVFMFHYLDLSDGQNVFGLLGHIGYVGVDLFFVLSGYLIGHQIFSALADRKPFSLKTFYYRRFLRTLPNYLVVLALYFMITGFAERPLATPLWKFLTFTQNFNLHGGAFSHAWSLCIEEQFYLVLPLIALFIAYKGSIKTAWYILVFILVAGILWRTTIWFIYIQHAGEMIHKIYSPKIYYSTFSRLDGLVFGVALALVKNFHKELWARLTEKGNLWLLLGLLGCCFTCYDFFNLPEFFPTVFGYPLRTISFAALTLAALSPGSLLSMIRIPGALTTATWSYAIYLTHKEIIHLTMLMLGHFAISKSNLATAPITIVMSLAAGWILYTCIEKPFLRLRDKLGKANTISDTIVTPINISPLTDK